MWVIYVRPSDYPNYVVLRRWWVTSGTVRAETGCDLFATVEEAREALPPGLYCLGRSPQDEPQIKEVWI